MYPHPTTVTLWLAAIIFAVAIVHTFSTAFFERMAHRQPKHAGVWHLLGEVEVVFGFWAFVLIFAMFSIEGSDLTVKYVNSRNFTEPMFVFAIMVVAGTRPILQLALGLVRWLAHVLPLPGSMGVFAVVLSVVPLLGSLITEPAAMTVGALILSQQVFARGISTRLMYASIGVLFVNVSIGGTLTSFAAPPVLMVASVWGWDSAWMLANFGWKAAIAVLINTIGVTVLFRHELAALALNKQEGVAIPAPVDELALDTGNHDVVSLTAPTTSTQTSQAQGLTQAVPWTLTVVHVLCLIGIVGFAHYPPLFMGIFLLFLGVAQAYHQHQDRLILREGLLVAFFLAGLVVLGGLQQWWLQPLLMSLSVDAVFIGATVLTAVTDNAALTYLGSLVEGLSDAFKYALVAGAVTGGGLTLIANAPNPAGNAILRGHFPQQTVQPLGLLLAAFLPTCVAAAAFMLL